MVELAVLHGRFQSAVDGGVPGQEASLRTRADKPRVMLKVLSNKLELWYGQTYLSSGKYISEKTYAELI